MYSGGQRWTRAKNSQQRRPLNRQRWPQAPAGWDGGRQCTHIPPEQHHQPPSLTTGSEESTYYHREGRGEARLTAAGGPREISERGGVVSPRCGLRRHRRVAVPSLEVAAGGGGRDSINEWLHVSGSGSEMSKSLNWGHWADGCTIHRYRHIAIGRQRVLTIARDDSPGRGHTGLRGRGREGRSAAPGERAGGKSELPAAAQQSRPPVTWTEGVEVTRAGREGGRQSEPLAA